MPCVKCEKEADHAIQIRDGDPTRHGTAPDKSMIQVIRLCDEHWNEVRKVLGL